LIQDIEAHTPETTFIAEVALDKGAATFDRIMPPVVTISAPENGKGSGPSSNSSSSSEVVSTLAVVVFPPNGSVTGSGSGSTYGQLVGSAHAEHVPDLFS